MARRRITPAIVGLVLVAVPASGVARATSPGIAPEARLARSLVGEGAPGSLVVVRTPARVRRAAAGLGRRQPRVAMRALDRFRVASITKTFVATVVLQLVGEGRLSLGDPVEKWLPGLVPNGEKITVRELLSHTSGLNEYMNDGAFVKAAIAHPARRWSPRRLVAIAVSHRPLFPPGTGWSYANTNYVVLGLVIEAATGKPVAKELRDRIFRPLGLAETSFPAGTGIAGHYAHGYVGFATLPTIPAGKLVDASTAVSPSIAWAAGAIVSNADDVTKFYATLLRGGLVRPDLLRAMKRPVLRTNDGLGLFRVQTACGPAFGHDGISVGYRNVVYSRPDGSRVADVMVNIDSTYVAQKDVEKAAKAALCFG